MVALTSLTFAAFRCVDGREAVDERGGPFALGDGKGAGRRREVKSFMALMWEGTVDAGRRNWRLSSKYLATTISAIQHGGSHGSANL